jgi:uncharacterized protein (DUF885 family)
LLATVALAAGLSAAPTFAADADSAAHRLFEDYFERQLQLNPLLATFIGDHRYDDKLTNNISPEHIAIALDVDRKALESAQKLAAGQLSDADRLSVEILMHDLRASLEGAKFPGELAPINQFQSLPTKGNPYDAREEEDTCGGVALFASSRARYGMGHSSSTLRELSGHRVFPIRNILSPKCN